MTNNDLLNTDTNELMNKEVTRKMAITAYIVFSIAAIMVLLIFVSVKTKEIELLKGKAHNDSLAVQSYKNNLLEVK